MLGQHAAAIEAARRAVDHVSNAQTRAALGYCYGVAGKRAQAIDPLDRLSALSHTRYLSPHTLAQIHLGLRQHDQALECLESALEDRTPQLCRLNVDPVYGPLRVNRRCDRLLTALKLENPRPKQPASTG